DDRHLAIVEPLILVSTLDGTPCMLWKRSPAAYAGPEKKSQF
ncbi:hypothetical protein MTO96_050197, partial [Rhipicephalus appendiculatus]